MHYWWQCEINSNVAELIIYYLHFRSLLANSDSFDSLQQTDDSNSGHQFFCSQN